MNEPKVGVTYVGRRDTFTDNIYGTGLTWAKGDTHAIPQSTANRFLRHPEFEAAAGEVKQKSTAKTSKEADTEAQLEAARKEQEKQQEEQNRLLDLRQSVLQMDKDRVLEFVKVNFNQSLPKNIGLAKAQEKAQQLIDQFGAP